MSIKILHFNPSQMLRLKTKLGKLAFLICRSFYLLEIQPSETDVGLLILTFFCWLNGKRHIREKRTFSAIREFSIILQLNQTEVYDESSHLFSFKQKCVTKKRENS